MGKSVLLRAPVLTNSGYGTHARQIARWLFDKEDELGLDVTVEPLNWGHTGWMTDLDAEGGLVGRVIQASQNTKPFYDVTIQLQLPNEWNPMLGRFNIGVTAGVEVDKCNPDWIAAVNRMNLVIVPSEFTKYSFTNSGPVKTKIEVIPESYIDECVNTNPGNPLPLSLDTNFNLLIFGQIAGNTPENDRKNLAYTIKWLAECLADRPDVGVVVKTNVVRNTRVDQTTAVHLLTQLIAKVKVGPGPKFHLLHGAMTNEEVAALYRHPKIKALVSLTHGEGFGLPILEAAVSGLPVISTGWSAHTEFLKHGKTLHVDYSLGPIHESRVDNQIFMPGAQWAFPNEQDAKRRIRKFVDSPAMPTAWAKEMAEKLSSLYSFRSISEQYDKLLLPLLETR